MGSAPRQAAGATVPCKAFSNGSASAYEIGSVGIVVRVFASFTSMRFAPGTAATPGVSGSPENCGRSSTLPRCTPSRFRIGPSGNTAPAKYPSSRGSE